MRPIQQRPSPLVGVTFPLLTVFLFAVFTGAPELIGILHAVHPVLVIGGLGLIAVFVTGRFMEVVFSPVGKVLTLFTVWFILCIPMSIWRGGSFQIFTEDWSKSFLAYVLTAGLITTVAQEKKAFHAIAYSVGILACLALGLHRYDATGRLSIMGTRYGNANELGFALLVGVAFLGFMYSERMVVKKAAAVLLAVPVLIALAKTGSRSCLLGAGILVLFVFFQASAATRAKLVLVAPVLFVLLLLVVPSNLRERYTTLFSSEQQDNGLAGASKSEIEAAGSTEARMVALRDSIVITLRHPFAGVGPGNFPVEQNNMALARGDSRGLWRLTHNTYTQLSSEMGIPGLVIYLAFLYQCWRSLTAITRSKYVTSDVREMAKTLRAVLVVLFTVAAFDALAYNSNIPIIGGLATALSFIARDQRAAFLAKRSASQPEPTVLPEPEPEPEPAWHAAMY